jgi:hypothetical protein
VGQSQRKERAMLRLLEDLPENVLGVEATGKVTDEDYERVLLPAVRERREAHRRIRFVYVLGEDFDGWTMGAMWEDAKLGLEDPRAWEKIALVSDKDWLRHTVKAFAWMIPGEVRFFGLDGLDEAKRWVAA